LIGLPARPAGADCRLGRRGPIAGSAGGGRLPARPAGRHWCGTSAGLGGTRERTHNPAPETTNAPTQQARGVARPCTTAQRDGTTTSSCAGRSQSRDLRPYPWQSTAPMDHGYDRPAVFGGTTMSLGQRHRPHQTDLVTSDIECSASRLRMAGAVPTDPGKATRASPRGVPFRSAPYDHHVRVTRATRPSAVGVSSSCVAWRASTAARERRSSGAALARSRSQVIIGRSFWWAPTRWHRTQLDVSRSA
jgi:hypothetical protein